MTHRNPKRRDYDTANLRRRANFARPKRQWLEVWREREHYPGPYILDITGQTPEEIRANIEAITITGGTATLRQGRCPDERRKDENQIMDKGSRKAHESGSQREGQA